LLLVGNFDILKIIPFKEFSGIFNIQI